jgi:hypothetical protein
MPQDPPRNTRAGKSLEPPRYPSCTLCSKSLPYQFEHHSHTFPCMSRKPYAFPG